MKRAIKARGRRLLEAAVDLPLRGVPPDARALLDRLGSSIIILLLSRAGRVLDLALGDLTPPGTRREALCGLSVWDLPCWQGTPDAPGRLRHAVRIAALGGRTNFAMQGHGGQTSFDVECSIAPARTAGGGISGLVLSGSIVTAGPAAERRAEDARRIEHARSLALLEAREAERRQIARELHDELGQTLSAVKMAIESLRGSAESPERLNRRLDDSVSMLDAALRQVRSRCMDLHAPLLDDRGLGPALRRLAERHAARTGLRVTFEDLTAGARFSPEVELACFRIAQEALTNVSRHAAATSAWVTLTEREAGLHLRVRDDGTGFDVARARAGAARGDSLGLVGMQERAALAGGAIEWRRGSRGGTQLHAWFGHPRSETGAGAACAGMG